MALLGESLHLQLIGLQVACSFALSHRSFAVLSKNVNLLSVPFLLAGAFL
jgi:hypothetical protein